MSKHDLRFLRNEVIEQVTTQRIREYESKSCTAVTLPVPVEEIIEQVLGLDFDWDEIEELPGEQILAGLDAVNRKILVNEKHVGLFEEKPVSTAVPSVTKPGTTTLTSTGPSCFTRRCPAWN